MPDVFRLAYVDLATASLDRALDYYQNVIGATVVQSGGQESYLSLGLDHHNISLRESSRPHMRCFGLQLKRDVPLLDLQRRLRELGLTVHLKSNARPGVDALLEVPNIAGHTVQLFSEMDMPAPGFGKSGILPNRIGHLALLTPEAPKLLTFLTDVLGFWKTDWFEQQVTFVTCNRDHHVLNVVEAPIVGVHHVAFELRGRDHQVDAADKLSRMNYPIVWGPSRHTAGHNLATYHHGADQLLVEFYNDMDVFLPDLNSFEPRPWHEDLPQAPKHWSFSEMTAWRTGFSFDFLEVAWGVSETA